MGNFSISMFLGMGGVGGPLLGGFLNDAFGMESVFYVMAALSAFATLLVGISLPEAKRSTFTAPEGGDAIPLRESFRLPVMRGGSWSSPSSAPSGGGEA